MDAVAWFKPNCRRFHACGGAAGNRRSQSSAGSAEQGGGRAISRSAFDSIDSGFRYIGDPELRSLCATKSAGNNFSH